jgi:membrane-associated protein
MDYATFFRFNLIGGFIWTSGLSLLGYGLGNVIPDVDKYLLPITIAIVVISVVPSLLHLLPEREK